MEVFESKGIMNFRNECCKLFIHFLHLQELEYTPTLILSLSSCIGVLDGLPQLLQSDHPHQSAQGGDVGAPDSWREDDQLVTD